jgi:transcriptional regulator with GAF, ATPase, and Fis domain/tetratricopeptide (TPR) repeat protein
MKRGDVLQSRYVVEKVLGHGGTGRTYLVTDLVWEQRLALKLVSMASPELADLLRDEFLLLKGLTHPHLLQIRDLGRHQSDLGGESYWYYAAEYAEGQPLDQWAQGRAVAELLRVLGNVAEALDFLHSIGMLHGDVKPGNVIVDNEGRATLIDLGCARPIGSCAAPSGTPGFLPPEVLEGAAADRRADAFALGISIGHLLPLLSEPPSPELLHLVERLTSGQADERPSDMGEVLESLGLEPSRRPARTLTGRLVGREEEMALYRRLLSALLEQTEDVRGVVLEGPDGIGRSRLLAEMKWHAQLVARVIEGSPTEEGAVRAMVQRAATGERAANLDGLLRQKEEVVAAGQPVVFIVDNIHRLPREEMLLFEAVLRSLSPADPLLVVAAGQKGSVAQVPSVQVLSLSPLTRGQVELWVRDVLPAPQLDELMRVTGGFPAHVQGMVARRAGAGGLAASELSFLFAPDDDQWVEDLRRSLAQAELDLLGLLALHDGGLTPTDLVELGSSKDRAALLNQQGWARWEAGEYSLARRAESVAIVSALGEARRQRLRQSLVGWLRRRLAARGGARKREHRDRPRLIGHLFELGRIAEAEREVHALASDGGEALRTESWREAVSALAKGSSDTEIHLIAADAEAALGHHQRALTVLENLLSHRLEPELSAEALRRVAACHIVLGRVPDALRALESVPPDAQVNAVTRARTADLASRAFIKQRDHGKAREVAESALAACADVAVEDKLLAGLRLNAGLAANYLGDLAAARRHLEAATGLFKKADDIQGRIRAQSYRALAEYHGGDLAAASAGFHAVLEMAEEQGLSDHVATASLNLGTVCHQMGDLGGAGSAYERGLRLASALGLVSNEVTLLFDTAMLYLDVGLFERARTAVDNAEAKASAAGLERVVASCRCLKGELALVQGDGATARQWLQGARVAFERDQAHREMAEADLLQVEALLLTGEDRSGLSELLDQATASLNELEAGDLLARASMLRARVLVDLDNLQGAIDEVERGIATAQRVGKRLLEAELHRCAAEIFEHEEASYAADGHRRQGQELLERVATTLPRSWRDAFRRHPRYQLPVTLPPGPQGKDREGGASHDVKLRHLLAINKRLNSSLDAVEVLRVTMDAAIELTGAERGFAIFTSDDGGDLEVPVARNLDREQLCRSRLKFSQSIARSVIESGEPVIAVDAGRDARFEDQASIHAMRLKSVMCVPIRAQATTIGALYLDNRFKRGRFTPHDRELLLAFADQAALAISNARLHGKLAQQTEELRQRTRELEAERARVEELVADQVGTIERLSEELRLSTQQLPSLRHDYSDIVGQSRAMHAVFEKLDRVIDTPLTVLIQGESGTGKELCARAIHGNSPRSNGPFVSLNCGALPESLLEAELFGHVKGAFTGALSDRAGLFQAAQGGTLFLDEVGEMPTAMQVKLLRATQEKEVIPVGGRAPIGVDVRLVCATNRRLSDEVHAGRFRADLYYRLAVVQIALPPLRERAEDIPLLAEHFLSLIAKRLERPPPTLRQDAWKALATYGWPGNVRQLENALTTALVFSQGEAIGAGDLQLPPSSPPAAPPADQPVLPGDRQAFERHEAERIRATLRDHGWNVRATAAFLSMPRSSLYNKMKRYGIHRSRGT